MSKVTLITGGARSGKSRRALELARGHAGRPAFIATAELFDEEMRTRAEKHRKERGESFLNIEAPLDPAEALRALPGDVEIVILDCLTVWLGNLFHHRGDVTGNTPEIVSLWEVLDSPPCDLLVVSNEVGMGIVPHNETSRAFRDLAGRINQEAARRADQVVLMVSGLPLAIKGEAS